MINKITYHKHIDKYLELLEQFSNYITVHKLDKMGELPKESTIVLFDEKDIDFSAYSNLVLKNLLKKKTKNILEVRKTGIKELPWKISTPINITA